MIGIYSFRNKFNQKRYIGKSINIENRYNAHMGACFNRNEDGYFYRALRKYGVENFDFTVLIECPEENLNYWEKFYIRYYCSNNNDYGYNLTNGGDGTSGLKHSDEWKEKQAIIQKEVQLKYWASEEGKNKAKHHSDVMKGRKHTQEWKDKQSKRLKGHSCSEETREKLRKGNLGRKHTDITRKHMSEAHMGNKPGNTGKHKVYNDDTHTKYHYE